MTAPPPLYLDYHATTPCDPAVVAAMLPYFSDRFGNAGSSHTVGRQAAKAVAGAKAQIAGLIGAHTEDIILTSGATEANNIALRAIAASAPAGRHEIVISAIEHDSISACAATLAAQGFIIKIIPVTKDGFITPEAVARLVSDKTLLVSVMAANHEIGTVQNISKISAVVHRAGALIHCDAVQAAGRIPLDVTTLGVDMLSLSAHKIYGPQGIGALYVRPTRHNGNVQALKTGTVPLPLAVGFGVACDIAALRLAEDAKHLEKLAELMITELQNSIPGLQINGARAPRLPGSLNICLRGIDATDLLLDLSNDLCLSTGSACRPAGGAPSAVLKAIGLSDIDIHGSLRICLGRPTTEKDILHAVAKIKEATNLQISRNPARQALA